MTKDTDAVIGIIGVTMAILTILGVCALLFHMEQKSTIQDAQERQDCAKSNVQFGDKVTAKEGFYKGLKMNAVGKSDYSISVSVPNHTELETMRFHCGDLQKL